MDMKTLKKRFFEDLERKTPEELAKELDETSEDSVGSMIVRAWVGDKEFFEEEEKSNDE